MNGQQLTSENTGVSRSTHLISLRSRDSVRNLSSTGFAGGEEHAEYLLLIDPRALDRECLSRSLREYQPSLNIVAANSLEDWLSQNIQHEPSAILLMIGGKKIGDNDVGQMITRLIERFKSSPVVVGAESDELSQVLKALEYGARGYIPTAVSISVAAEAIGLAQAGGIFVPASSVLAAKDIISAASNNTSRADELFTPREAVVAEALLRGKANKIIAYEMKLCESTVKVHIRNIMKKLHATNRTEVAYKIRDFMH
jgi:DNA-binding NarL/FixJ family response regulator